jgi:SAM-dependent methyltransferase
MVTALPRLLLTRAATPMLTSLQFRILKVISPGEPNVCSGAVYDRKSKLKILMGEHFFAQIAGKVVIDFGCGEGRDAVEMAQNGASRVIGLDIREEVLRVAGERAARAGVAGICVFATAVREQADAIVSLDAFEHFADPAEILRIMSGMLRSDGEALISFGPTWYHPLGGHLFSVFPWAHLIFSERALIRWRATFKTDGATRFSETAGGLNQMTIARFQRLVDGSPLRFSSLELVPIRKLRRLHNRLTREFTTAIVRCRLVKRV